MTDLEAQQATTKALSIRAKARKALDAGTIDHDQYGKVADLVHRAVNALSHRDGYRAHALLEDARLAAL